MTVADVLLIAFGAVAVGAALRVVTSPLLVRAGLWLVVALAAVAAMYLMLTAELVAWVQVLIYVGAVVVLLLFAMMLTRAPVGPSKDLDRPRIAGVLVGGGAGLGLAALFIDAYRWVHVGLPKTGTADRLGTAVFQQWVLPFEVISVLLLAALIGAIVVSRSEGTDGPAARAGQFVTLTRGTPPPSRTGAVRTPAVRGGVAPAPANGSGNGRPAGGPTGRGH